MLRMLWWLSGQRRILTTTLPQYRQIGQVLCLAGRCYRVTHVYGSEVWGRPLRRPPEHASVLTIESPIKQFRRQAEMGSSSSSSL